jgi:hypothetical protein
LKWSLKKTRFGGFFATQAGELALPPKKEQNQPVAKEIPWHIAINLEANSSIHS